MKILVTNLVHLGPLDLPAGVEAVPFDETEPVPARHRDAGTRARRIRGR